VNVPSSKFVRAFSGMALAAVMTTGCVSHSHTVGLGATGTGRAVAHQYYLGFGLIALNSVDTQRLAPDLTSYTVETSFGFVDFLWSPFLLPFTMTSRTVIVRT
jgi:hypothetical protein